MGGLLEDDYATKKKNEYFGGFRTLRDMEPMLIRDMAMVERPRERLGKLGAEALKAEELLALVLRTGYKGHGAVEVAREILEKFSVPQLLSMPMASLSAIRGMGESRAAALLAAAELVRRADLGAGTALPVLQSVGDVAAQAIDIRDKKKEYLLAFFLNARHQLIAKETISIGTLTASLAHPRLCAAQHKRGYVLSSFMLSRHGSSSNVSPLTAHK
jgi:DNA repair protein RadC